MCVYVKNSKDIKRKKTTPLSIVRCQKAKQTDSKKRTNGSNHVYNHVLMKNSVRKGKKNKNFSYYSAMLIHNSTSFEEVIIQNVPLLYIFSFQNLCGKQTEIVKFQLLPLSPLTLPRFLYSYDDNNENSIISKVPQYPTWFPYLYWLIKN